MPSFGTMRPKLIAKVIVAAVTPSAIVAFKSSKVVCEPSAICRRPLATPKEVNARHHRHYGSEADGRKGHLPTASNWSEDHSDDETSEKSAGGDAKTEDGERCPS